jgi:hypothetical protein
LWGLDLPDGKTAERWRELSPALNAARVTAPLLMNSSDSEYTIALQLYTSLMELNKPVELFIYADEGHIKNQPKHRYEIYQRNLDWFSFWLQHREDPDPAKVEQYLRWRAMRNKPNEDRPATYRPNVNLPTKRAVKTRRFSGRRRARKSSLLDLLSGRTASA